MSQSAPSRVASSNNSSAVDVTHAENAEGVGESLASIPAGWIAGSSMGRGPVPLAWVVGADVLPPYPPLVLWLGSRRVGLITFFASLMSLCSVAARLCSVAVEVRCLARRPRAPPSAPSPAAARSAPRCERELGVLAQPDGEVQLQRLQLPRMPSAEVLTRQVSSRLRHGSLELRDRHRRQSKYILYI